MAKVYDFERIDDLQVNGLKIIQNPEKYCFTSDAVLLANTVKANYKSKVCDLCTGSGVIAILIQGKQNVECVAGIEIQKDIANMAKRSVELNNLQDKITIYNISVQDAPRLIGQGLFDIVVVNPPYASVNTGEIVTDSSIAISKSEIKLKLSELALSASKLVKFGGKFYIIHRAGRLAEIIYELKNVGLEPKVITLVYPKISKNADTVIIESVKGAKQGVILKKLIVFNEDNSYTDEAKRLYSISWHINIWTYEVMNGVLYIVGTPIGNLGDITLRAIETLKTVDIIACEDTRVSLTLLNEYGIKKPLYSYYKHKEREGAKKLIGELLGGKNIALITDAGMPAISDPGAILVEEAHKNKIKVCVIPGASAVVSAIAMSGLQCKGFTFLGFLADKLKAKNAEVEPFIYSPLPLVFYCSPHSINSDAKFLFEILGDRKVYIVKEITKMFESMEIKNLNGFNIENPKGEYVMIVEGLQGESPLNSLSIVEQVQHYMQSGLSKKDAIKRTASDRNIDKNSVYIEALDL